MDKYDISLNKMATLISHMKEKEEMLKVENKIFETEDTLKKVIAFQNSQDKYNDALKYNLDNKEEIRKELIENKKIMDEDPLVALYNKLYYQVVEPTLYLEQELHKVLDIKGDKNQC